MNRFEFLKKIKLPKPKIPSVGRIIFFAVVIGLSAATFVFARNFTACWNLTGLPGMMPASCGGSTGLLTGPDLTSATQQPGVVDLPPTPAPVAPGVELPPAWDGGSRINILFIGLDFRDWQANEGPPRSDTMILFTIDPVTKSAGSFAPSPLE